MSVKLFLASVGAAVLLPAAGEQMLCQPDKEDHCFAVSRELSIITSVAFADDQNVVLDKDVTKGWTDLPKSGVFGFADYLLNLPVTIPKYTVMPRMVQFGCPKKNLRGSVGGCDAFIFMYQCPPCEVSSSSQLLKQRLLKKGWEMVPCRGNFRLQHAMGSHSHKLVTYHKEFEPTDSASPSLSLLIDEPVTFMFWGMSSKRNMCQTRTDEVTCLDSDNDCFWDGSDCKAKLCRQLSGYSAKGPWLPQCQTCINEEKTLLIQ